MYSGYLIDTLERLLDAVSSAPGNYTQQLYIGCVVRFIRYHVNDMQISGVDDDSVRLWISHFLDTAKCDLLDGYVVKDMGGTFEVIIWDKFIYRKVFTI